MLAILLRCWLLCPQLGDEDFGVRIRAHNELQRADAYAVPALLYYRNDPDPEIRKRCGELLQPFASRARMFGNDLAAVWILYGPRFDDDDALLTWFHSRPAEVAAVIDLADRHKLLSGDWSRDYLSLPDWWPWRVPLWYQRLRWAAEGGR